MNTVILLLFLLGKDATGHPSPVSASTLEISAETCAAYEATNTVDDGFIVVCETRAEVQHDLAGGRCYVNPVKPAGDDGEALYICNHE